MPGIELMASSLVSCFTFNSVSREWLVTFGQSRMISGAVIVVDLFISLSAILPLTRRKKQSV